MSILSDHLHDHFDASQAGELDLTIRFDWHDGHLDGHLSHCDIQWIQVPTEPADLTLYFADEQCALDILTAKLSPIDAFMHGDFRSSGYIVWTFALLRIFAAPAPSSG